MSQEFQNSHDRRRRLLEGRLGRALI